jgi:NADH dehydrogenase (ubiquinone) 1 beta subcomplex subunit 9
MAIVKQRADGSGNSSLYRRSLKLALDWSVHRYLWRGQALYIRSLFEANKGIRDPRQQRVGLKNGLLEKRTYFASARRCSERPKSYWRNGNTLTRTTRPRHQEV